MFLDPCLVRFDAADGNRHRLRLGHLLLDDYLELVAARARPNTLLAAAWDLKVFFGVVAKDPVEVTTADVLAFISDQRRPRRGLGWCGWRTASRAWRPARSSGGWRAWGAVHLPGDAWGRGGQPGAAWAGGTPAEPPCAAPSGPRPLTRGLALDALRALGAAGSARSGR